MRRLIVIVDYGFCGSEERFLSALRELSSYAIRYEYELQIRIKEETPETTKELSLRAIQSVKGRVPIVLNADPKLAVELGYDGVHFPEDRHGDVEKFVSRNLQLSVACHSIDSLCRINELPVTKILYSPIFKPSWKSVSSETHGIGGLKSAIANSNIPVYALGGISPERADSCVSAGAQGIAVLSGILGSPDVKARIGEYLRALDY